MSDLPDTPDQTGDRKATLDQTQYLSLCNQAPND